MEKRGFVIANCAEGLSLFDQECKDKAGKGYPVIDKQVLYEGNPTLEAIDMCGIQAHAGYYMIGSGGNEFKFKKTEQLVSLEGFEYIELGQVGSESEGPVYYLQTLSKDYELVYEERNLWEKDYYLEFYNHKMVEVSGKHIKENIIKVNRIRETCASHL